MSATKILVVEDEVITSEVIADQLAQLGYTITDTVTSGTAALTSIAKALPDLVLMDVVLKKGDIDGITTAARIRAQFKIPVVYLTAYSDEATLDRAKATEAFGYIVKPFHERDLRTAIEMALEKHRRERLVEDVMTRAISEHKQAEAQIKESLQEKEVLLKEVHHRVKNNFQLISSLLNLHSEAIKDQQALEILKAGETRVNSMALVHKQLYQSEDLEQINFAEYIQTLAANLFDSYEFNSNIIALKINSENIQLSVDIAIPCGLIINELVLNSLKYAFPLRRRGEVCITFHKDDNNQLFLVVSDNGIGLPSDFDFQNPESLGLQIVVDLVSQISGTIVLNRNNIGTEFKITFQDKIVGSGVALGGS